MNDVNASELAHKFHCASNERAISFHSVIPNWNSDRKFIYDVHIAEDQQTFVGKKYCGNSVTIILVHWNKQGQLFMRIYP